MNVDTNPFEDQVSFISNVNLRNVRLEATEKTI